MKNQNLIREYLNHYIANDNRQKDLLNRLENKVTNIIEKKYYEQTFEDLELAAIPAFEIVKVIHDNQHDIETSLLCILANYDTLMKYNVDINLIEQMAEKNNIAFCFAKDNIGIKVSVERDMYDDMPGFASYYTNHMTEIKQGEIFMTDGKSPLDFHIDPDEFSGIGDSLRYTAYLETDWDQKVRLQDLRQYILGQFANDELHYINQIQFMEIFSEALNAYQYVFIENESEIYDYMSTKNLSMEYVELLDNVKLLGEYSDCPSGIKNISDKLTDEKIFNMCNGILYGVYSEYPYDINEVDSKLFEYQNRLKDLQIMRNSFEEEYMEEESETELE